MSLDQANLTAVILAGGQGRRMGGRDKGWIEIDGRPLVAHLIDQLESQGVAIAINANRNREKYAALGYPVISDELGDYQGPLAGFASAMHQVDTAYILTLPCDAPRIADDYVARFLAEQAKDEVSIRVAHDGERLQPVHALIRTDLLASLEKFLASGERKIDRWYAQHDFAQTDFSDRIEMFRNINTPEDHAQIEADL